MDSKLPTPEPEIIQTRAEPWPPDQLSLPRATAWDPRIIFLTDQVLSPSQKFSSIFKINVPWTIQIPNQQIATILIKHFAGFTPEPLRQEFTTRIKSRTPNQHPCKPDPLPISQYLNPIS